LFDGLRAHRNYISPFQGHPSLEKDSATNTRDRGLIRAIIGLQQRVFQSSEKIVQLKMVRIITSVMSWLQIVTDRLKKKLLMDKQSQGIARHFKHVA
jgi:hypothetical protein